MTEKVEIEFHNWSECKIKCSFAILNEISDVFSYFIPSAKFHPKYKAKKPHANTLELDSICHNQGIQGIIKIKDAKFGKNLLKAR